MFKFNDSLTRDFLLDEFAEYVNPTKTRMSNINPPLPLYAIMYESLLLEPFPKVW